MNPTDKEVVNQFFVELLLTAIAGGLAGIAVFLAESGGHFVSIMFLGATVALLGGTAMRLLIRSALSGFFPERREGTRQQDLAHEPTTDP